MPRAVRDYSIQSELAASIAAHGLLQRLVVRSGKSVDSPSSGDAAGWRERYDAILTLTSLFLYPLLVSR